jgi:lysine/ornithine N-monooxygenase
MKNNICIIGAGPRGISVALALLHRGITSTLIDPKVCSSWDKSNVIPNLVMRSPITFDLVTSIEDLQEFSLSKFLKVDTPFSRDQKVIEANKHFVTRKQFHSYILFHLNYLVSQGCLLIEEPVVSISKTSITTELTEIPYSHLVIATGNYSASPKIPSWISKTQASSKLVNPQQIIKSKPKGKSINVIGSGQGAAEFVQYLSPNNKVSWIQNQTPRVSQYPGPSWADVGSKSSLGPYYKTYVTNSQQRSSYKTLLSKYSPTITPYISNELSKLEFEILEPSSIRSNLLDLVDLNLCVCGFNVDVSKIPFSFDIERSLAASNYPNLNKFKMPNTNVYFTGILAAMYDGPRQNSIISSGPTSEVIASDICQM